MSKLAWNNWKHPDLWAAFDMQTLTEAGKMKDMTGNGRDLTINGTPAIVDSILPARRALDGRKARYFNGTTDSLTNTTVQPPVECTIIAVLRLDAAATTNLAVYLQNNTYPTDLGYTQYGAVTDKPTIYGRHNNTMAIMPFPGIGVQHVAALVKNGTRLTGYLNGMRRGAAAVASDTSSTGFAIGAYNPAAPSSRWQGVIDVVHIYNRALTDGEIRAWYQSCQYLNNHKRTHDGVTLWDGVECGIWDDPSSWGIYYTGSASKSVTPVMDTPNYMGQIGITDGRFNMRFGSSWSPFRPRGFRTGWNGIRGRIWCAGTPKTSGIDGRIIVSIENGVSTPLWAVDGVGPGWNDFDVKVSEAIPGYPHNPTKQMNRFLMWSDTAHATDPLTEVVIADVEFYKTAKTRYDFNSQSELDDWEIVRESSGGQRDASYSYWVEDSKLTFKPNDDGTESGYWGIRLKKDVLLKGQFKLRAKCQRKIGGSSSRAIGIRAVSSIRETSDWFLDCAYPWNSAVGWSANYELTKALDNDEFIFGIVRTGTTGLRAYFMQGNSIYWFKYVDINVTGDITEIQIIFMFETSNYLVTDRLAVDWIEWEEF